MSKVTVVTDAQGKIVAIGHGHLSQASAKKTGSRGGLLALAGQHLRELEVAEDLTATKSFMELHDKVRSYVK